MARAETNSPMTSPKPRADATSAGPLQGVLGMVPVDLIDAEDRLRLVNIDKAVALAERFRVQPMRSPVLVSGPNEAGRYRLRFGGHRLAAHVINEAPDILALVVPAGAALDEDDFRLMEIAENIERFELTVLDRAASIAEWRRIFEVRNGKVKSGRPKRNSAPSAQLTEAALDEASAAFSGTFSEAAQAAFGLAHRSIYEALKIATIDALVRGMIAFFPIANSKTELLQLAGESPVRQDEIAQLLTENPALSVSDAIAAIDHLPAPKRPAPVDKVSNAFAALKPSDQHKFFALHEAAIELWLLQRKK